MCGLNIGAASISIVDFVVIISEDIIIVVVIFIVFNQPSCSFLYYHLL